MDYLPDIASYIFEYLKDQPAEDQDGCRRDRTVPEPQTESGRHSPQTPRRTRSVPREHDQTMA